MELLPEWGMNNEETVNKIYRSCFDNAMYLFRMHYQNAKGRQNRKTVLEYNWNSMLFEEIIENPQKYANPNSIKLYQMLINKKYFLLKIYLLKNKNISLYIPPNLKRFYHQINTIKTIL